MTTTVNQYLHELWKRKDLLIYQVSSGLKAQHRNTFLGYLWWLLDPLLFFLMYYFLRIVLMGRAGENIVPFLAIGLIVFRNFSSSLTGSAGSITGQAGLITQVYLPKAMFPLSVVLTQLVNFGFGLVIIAAVLVATGLIPGPELVWLPLVILTQTLFHLAIGLFMAYACAFVRDLENLLRYVTRVMRYTSPVIWEVDRLPDSFQWVVAINPFAWLLNAYRDVLMYGSLPSFPHLFALLGGSAVVSTALVVFYSYNEHRIIKAL